MSSNEFGVLSRPSCYFEVHTQHKSTCHVFTLHEMLRGFLEVESIMLYLKGVQQVRARMILFFVHPRTIITCQWRDGTSWCHLCITSWSLVPEISRDCWDASGTRDIKRKEIRTSVFVFIRFCITHETIVDLTRFFFYFHVLQYYCITCITHEFFVIITQRWARL